jgi:hypothetical protein
MPRILKWFSLLAIVLPVTFQAAWSYAAGWPPSWSRANWSSTGTLPPAATHPQAMIRIYAARSGRWKSIFAVHHWIVVKPADGNYSRYEVVGWGTPVRHNNYPPDGRWYSNDPQVVHELHGAKAERLIPLIRNAVADYRWQGRGSYTVWPGPNSNTFVAHVLRQVPELAAEMDPAGIGKDYLGPGLAVARTPSGTGWQVSAWGLAGAALAVKEGVEMHILGATIGIDFDDLRLKLPAIGALGFAMR